jgi:hypothetical protein
MNRNSVMLKNKGPLRRGGAGGPCFLIKHPEDLQQVVEKQESGCQPRRAANWKAQHIDQYVSIYRSRTTQDHSLRRRFSTN